MLLYETLKLKLKIQILFIYFSLKLEAVSIAFDHCELEKAFINIQL